MKQSNLARIVLIEDNPGDVFILRHALDAQGHPYQLEVLQDGEEALRFVREHASAATPEPCLLILDLHLAKYDGLTVLKAIREVPALACLHIGVLTEIISPQEETEVLGFDPCFVMAKPRDVAGFMKLAEQVFLICDGHSWTAAA